GSAAPLRCDARHNIAPGSSFAALLSTMTGVFSHVVGFDDAPFEREHRGDVRVVGAVYAGLRLDGVLSAKVRRDGINATAVLIGMLRASRFLAQMHLVLLHGI